MEPGMGRGLFQVRSICFLAFRDLPVEMTSRPSSLSLLALHVFLAGVKPDKFCVLHMSTIIAVWL